MRIRSITVFDGTASQPTAEVAEVAGRTAKTVRARLEDAGFVVQTTRLALHGIAWGRDLVRDAQEWERLTLDNGIDYVSLGPVRFAQIDAVADALAATTCVFASAIAAPVPGHVEGTSCSRIARAICDLAQKTENGFGNLRFAALAKCGSGIPFFPAAYAGPGQRSFALAIETAKLALEAVGSARDSADARWKLTQAIEAQGERIRAALAGIESFDGCDWSLAPHPDRDCSVGAALEKLSGARFGEWGTLTAVRTLTYAVRASHTKHVGFSGVFLPLLEDAVLAERCTPELDLQQLLLYCAVCGTGLDTIPLAGDVSEAAMAKLIGDVATLAVTLNKPLTVRLMPVPGLKAGERTRFDNPYLINAQVLGLGGA